MIPYTLGKCTCLQYATLSYMSLYDALFLYGLAVRDAYEETRNQSVFLDGLYIWKKMTARQFIGTVARISLGLLYFLVTGSTGQVLMNNKAIRVPSYATYHTKNGMTEIWVIIIMVPQLCPILPSPHYYYRIQ